VKMKNSKKNLTTYSRGCYTDFEIPKLGEKQIVDLLPKCLRRK
jgi:hypothetical protein